MFPYQGNNVWDWCSQRRSLIWSLNRKEVLFSFCQSAAVNETLGSSTTGYREVCEWVLNLQLPQSHITWCCIPHSFCVYDWLLKSRGRNDAREVMERVPCWYGKGWYLENPWVLQLKCDEHPWQGHRSLFCHPTVRVHQWQKVNSCRRGDFFVLLLYFNFKTAVRF